MNNKELYELVEKKVKETVDKLNEKFNFNMKYPHIYYDVRGTTGGLAKSASMTVHFNNKLLKENIEHFIETTVPHEVCHIGVYHLCHVNKRNYPKNGHGADWQIMMRTVGVNARKYHEYEVERKEPVEYRYECGCPNGVIIPEKIHKKIKDKVMVCKKCNTKLGDWERVMKIGFKEASPNGTTKVRED